MKFFVDFLPLIAFVTVYFYSGSEQPMYPAVAALMVASVIQTIGSRLLTGKFEKLHLWTLLITLAFGALTLLFRQPEFIQWKASVVVWITASVFLFRQFVYKKLLIQEMLTAALDEKIEVPQKIWLQLNWLWPIAHIIFGFINLYVAFNFSEAFWVKFKLFGLMGMVMVLMFYSIYKLFPYLPKEEQS
ncbi:MAG: septation protein IspZ [Gammaproteobacteria bacterium]|nr:septation protein IspZ [Gammaproteobacteria bacterium]